MFCHNHAYSPSAMPHWNLCHHMGFLLAAPEEAMRKTLWPTAQRPKSVNAASGCSSAATSWVDASRASSRCVSIYLDSTYPAAASRETFQQTTFQDRCMAAVAAKFGTNLPQHCLASVSDRGLVSETLQKELSLRFFSSRYLMKTHIGHVHLG